jgi:hypothetical protein
VRVIAGATVEGLKRKSQRIDRNIERLNRLGDWLQKRIDASVDKFIDARNQAIADRYATIRVASDEIAELEKL